MKAAFNRWYDNLKEPWRFFLMMAIGSTCILLLLSHNPVALAILIVLLALIFYFRGFEV